MSVLADLSWQGDALCAQVGGDIHFPEVGESAIPAKRTCLACPARTSCLEWAIANGEEWGIWGGLSPEQRRLYANGEPYETPSDLREERNWAIAADRESGATTAELAAKYGISVGTVRVILRSHWGEAA